MNLKKYLKKISYNTEKIPTWLRLIPIAKRAIIFLFFPVPALLVTLVYLSLGYKTPISVPWYSIASPLWYLLIPLVASTVEWYQLNVGKLFFPVDQMGFYLKKCKPLFAKHNKDYQAVMLSYFLWLDQKEDAEDLEKEIVLRKREYFNIQYLKELSKLDFLAVFDVFEKAGEVNVNMNFKCPVLTTAFSLDDDAEEKIIHNIQIFKSKPFAYWFQFALCLYSVMNQSPLTQERINTLKEMNPDMLFTKLFEKYDIEEMRTKLVSQRDIWHSDPERVKRIFESHTKYKLFRIFF